MGGNRPQPHLLLKPNVESRGDPPGDGDDPLAAERLHLPLLQCTQQLRLCGERKIDDLIEEQRTAPSKLELPLLSLMGPGERALLVAEQLRLDQRVRDGATVHRDKWLVAAG